MDWHGFDTRVAAYVVIVDDADRLLLALWNGPEVPTWTMPGGGVELDESPEDAAVRELLEETGYAVRLDGYLGSDVEVIPASARLSGSVGGRPMKALRLVYGGEVTGGRLTNEVDGSTDEARWIPLAEVPNLRRVPFVDTALGLWRASRDPSTSSSVAGEG